ncbi:hypothetical protein EV714DRAFT_217412 [Schizophyllum commune]
MDSPVVDAIDAQTVNHLRAFAQEAADRCMPAASRWASELVLATAPAYRRQRPHFLTSTPARPRSTRMTPQSPESPTRPSIPSTSYRDLRAPPAPQSSEDELLRERHLEAKDKDVLDAARALVEAREFRRAAKLLEHHDSSKAKYLYTYSRFLASESDYFRDWYLSDYSRVPPIEPANLELVEIMLEVSGKSDPWTLFLKGLFFLRCGCRAEGIENLILAIEQEPWLYPAWMLLQAHVRDADEVSHLMPLLPVPPSHPMARIFQIKSALTFMSGGDYELEICDHLLQSDVFPNSPWIMGLRACVLSDLHEYDRAEQQFDHIFEMDPQRIEWVDMYSNVLLVTQQKVKLAKIAHEFVALAKDRPEVCVAIGNHFALRAEHMKAVKYFRRAAELDCTLTGPWTLMGHELVEMKNSHEAMDAYRRALTLNRRDYRAWYGLAQASELLSMKENALYYYQNAVALKPYDVRMLQGLAQCYENMGRLREAVDCLRRVLYVASPHEQFSTLKLASLHRIMGEYREAASYHHRIVQICNAENRPIADYAKSTLEVANYHMHNPGGNLHLARELLAVVAQSNAEDVDKAQEMLKEVNEMLQARQARVVAAKSSQAELKGLAAGQSHERMDTR